MKAPLPFAQAAPLLERHGAAKLYALPRFTVTSPFPVLAEIALRQGDGQPPLAFLVERGVFEALASADPRLRAMGDRVWAPRSPQPPRLMGILNVTPDSFSDGGRYTSLQAALDHARRMMDEGVAIIDIGGESTRPGAAPVPVEEECARVLPVLEHLRTEASSRGVVLSIDTRHGVTMRRALASGATMINDVTALAGDPESLDVAAAARCDIVLMHMAGEPQTMQHAPHYESAALDIFDALERRIDACRAAGIAHPRLTVDPGIGFGKLLHHNLDILNRLSLFGMLGTPVLLGASRKSFIAALSRKEPAGERLPGSLAVALLGAAGGAAILRVHDVAQTAQALAVWHAATAQPNEG
jgi:dihydropteroate synthase